MKNKILLLLLMLIGLASPASAALSDFSGVGWAKLVVNTLIIGLLLYVLFTLIGSKWFGAEGNWGRGVFIGVIVILAASLGIQMGNLWFWQDQAFFIPLYVYLFGTDSEGLVGILRPERILIFIAMSALLYWAFADKLKIGGDKKTIDLAVAIILAADMVHEGLSRGGAIAAGQIISLILLYSRFKGTEADTKFNKVAGIQAGGLVIWLSAVIFPGEGILGSFTGLVTTIGHFNFVLLILIMMVIGLALKKVVGDSEREARARSGTAENVGQHAWQILKNFANSTRIPILNELFNKWNVRNMVYGSGETLEFGPTIRKIWHEIWTNMNYMLRLEVYSSKMFGVVKTGQKLGTLFQGEGNTGDRTIHVMARSNLNANLRRFKLGTGHIYYPDRDPDTLVEIPVQQQRGQGWEVRTVQEQNPITGNLEDHEVRIHPKVVARIGVDAALQIGPRTGQWWTTRQENGIYEDFWQLDNTGELREKRSYGDQRGGLSSHKVMMAYMKGVKDGLRQIINVDIESETFQETDSLFQTFVDAPIQTELNGVKADWRTYEGYINRMNNFNVIEDLSKNIFDQLLLHGQYTHTYHFARIGAKIYSVPYQVEPDPNNPPFFRVVAGSRPEWRNPIELPITQQQPNPPNEGNGIQFTGEVASGEFPLREVDLDGYYLVDLNRIKFTGDANVPLRRIKPLYEFKLRTEDTDVLNPQGEVRKVRHPNVIQMPLASEAVTLIGEEWQYLVRDIRDGRYHPLTKKARQYIRRHQQERKWNYSNLEEDPTIPGRGNEAFDRAALIDPGKYVYWGKKLINHGENEIQTLDPVNPFPTLSTIGLTQYLASFINEFATEVERKQAEYFVWETGAEEKFYTGSPEENQN